jgi:uncharacterized membrane protein (UPF0127 family)
MKKEKVKTKVLKSVLIYLLLLAGVVNCVHAGVKMIPLYIGSEKFTVEVAETEEAQMKGLMYRKHVPDDFGMLFIHEEEGYRSMWMKNCFVSLDLVFLNKNKQVVDMYINVPPCKNEPCDTYPSRIPAQYVLELRANRAKELNLKIGDTLTFILD